MSQPPNKPLREWTFLELCAHYQRPHTLRRKEEWEFFSPSPFPRCVPSCLRCAIDAESQRRSAAHKRERHVPDPHYSDWGQ